jgi:hypothetical protein
MNESEKNSTDKPSSPNSNPKHYTRYLSSVEKVIDAFVMNILDSTKPEDWISENVPRMLVSIPVPQNAQDSLKQTYESIRFIEGTKPSLGELETTLFARLISLGIVGWLGMQLMTDQKNSIIKHS